MSIQRKTAYFTVVIFVIVLIIVGNRTQFEDERLVKLMPEEHSSIDSKDHMRSIDQRAATERDWIQSTLTLMDDLETGESKTIRQTMNPMDDVQTNKRYTSLNNVQTTERTTIKSKSVWMDNDETTEREKIRAELTPIGDADTPSRNASEKSTSLMNSLDEKEKKCSPLTNVVYIKAHKTGGSTLQNILYRFGDDRNLTFALPVTYVYIKGTEEFQPESILPPPPGKQYNILANHARLYYHDMKKIFPPNVRFITIIREAESHFESMYTYFGQHRKYRVDLNEFSLNPRKYYEKYKRKTGVLNGKDPLLFDLGINQDDMYNHNKVNAYIQFLDSKMDLVLLTEYYFESLILLKDLMCWDLETIVHLKSKERVYYNQSTAPKDDGNALALRKRLQEWNDGDFKLYDHFNRTFWKRVDEYGQEKMAAEIEELKDLCQKYQDECMGGTEVVDKTNWSRSFGLKEYVLREDKKDDKTCSRLSMNAMAFVDNLREKHLARLKKT